MSKVFDEIFASEEFQEEYFVASVQAKIANLLEEKGVSRAELARKLDVSRARVTQIFSDEAKNFTLRLLARSFMALDEEPVIITKAEYDSLQAKTGSSNAGVRTVSGGANLQVPMTLSPALIGELLRASLGVSSGPAEKPARKSDSARDWAKQGSNVVPMRERSYA